MWTNYLISKYQKEREGIWRWDVDLCLPYREYNSRGSKSYRYRDTSLLEVEYDYPDRRPDMVLDTDPITLEFIQRGELKNSWSRASKKAGKTAPRVHRLFPKKDTAVSLSTGMSARRRRKAPIKVALLRRWWKAGDRGQGLGFRWQV